MAPGPVAMSALDELSARALNDTESVLVLQAWERSAAWVAERSLAAVLAVTGAQECDEDDLTREEVRAALRLSGFRSAQRIDTARALVGPLAAARDALATGRITAAHATVLVEETERLCEQDRVEVADRTLVRAATQTVAQFRRAVQRAVARVDPIGHALEHEQAAQRRSVRRWTEANGVGYLSAELPVTELAEVWLAIDTLAGTLDPVVPIDVRRADALVLMARHSLADPSAPRPQGRPVAVNVLVDLPTALGLADNPAELRGFGPLPASVARALAADAGWRRWVTDPVTGHLLDAGHTTYQPPAALREHLLAAHATCRFPGCAVSAARCDLDHAVPFPRREGRPDVRPPGDDPGGGRTSAANLGPLCRRHHRLKTSGGWDLQVSDDLSVTWTSPAGLRYLLPPTRPLSG